VTDRTNRTNRTSIAKSLEKVEKVETGEDRWRLVESLRSKVSSWWREGGEKVERRWREGGEGGGKLSAYPIIQIRGYFPKTAIFERFFRIIGYADKFLVTRITLTG
jgi:hypothetical protein